MPGVAANLVGLIYIAGAQGRHEDARALIQGADAIAEAAGAHSIVRQVEQARAAVLGSQARRVRSGTYQDLPGVSRTGQPPAWA
jgi:hypothetical protein